MTDSKPQLKPLPKGYQYDYAPHSARPVAIYGDHFRVVIGDPALPELAEFEGELAQKSHEAVLHELRSQRYHKKLHTLYAAAVACAEE